MGEITQQYSIFRKLQELNRDSREEAKEKVWGGGNLKQGRGRFGSPVPPVNQWPISIHSGRICKQKQKIVHSH